MSEHKLKLSEEVRAANQKRFNEIKAIKMPASVLYRLPAKKKQVEK